MVKAERSKDISKRKHRTLPQSFVETLVPLCTSML